MASKEEGQVDKLPDLAHCTQIEVTGGHGESVPRFPFNSCQVGTQGLVDVASGSSITLMG
jgi:hypothetical protein